MTTKVLICSDLDRTLLPNGSEKESPEARKFLHLLAERPEITLAYVSGRNHSQLQDAIKKYKIPTPDYAVGDVGTSIYQLSEGNWELLDKWKEEISKDWEGYSHQQIVALFDGLADLKLQEPENQSDYKVSYYTPINLDYRQTAAAMRERLKSESLRASLIWSVDDIAKVGLLDILPQNATKYHAIKFLMRNKGFSERATVFAGDSGNDLPVLTSGLQAILVRNADDAVRRQAKEEVHARGLEDRLYCAKGGFLGMNGNYAAGVIEGLVYFIPETAVWLRKK